MKNDLRVPEDIFSVFDSANDIITKEQVSAVERSADGFCHFPAGQYEGWCVFPEKSVFDGPSGFGSACEFGAESVFPQGCVFNNGNHFGPRCEFGPEQEFGNDSKFSVGCCFGRGSKFGPWSYFGPSCVIGEGCSVGRYATFGDSCLVKNECKIGYHADLGSRVTLGPGCFATGFDAVGPGCFLRGVKYDFLTPAPDDRIRVIEDYALVSTNTDNALFFLASDGEIFIQVERSGEFCRGTLDEFLSEGPANRFRITQERAEALASAARLLLSGNGR